MPIVFRYKYWLYLAAVAMLSIVYMGLQFNAGTFGEEKPATKVRQAVECIAMNRPTGTTAPFPRCYLEVSAGSNNLSPGK